MVSLWDMLTALCGASALGGAVAGAKVSGGGMGRMTIAIAVGLALGWGAGWLPRAVARRVTATIAVLPESSGNARARVLYLGTMVWAAAASFVGLGVSSAILGWVSP